MGSQQMALQINLEPAFSASKESSFIISSTLGQQRQKEGFCKQLGYVSAAQRDHGKWGQRPCVASGVKAFFTPDISDGQ